MSPTRARTLTTRFGDGQTNHKANAPPILIIQSFNNNKVFAQDSIKFNSIVSYKVCFALLHFTSNVFAALNVHWYITGLFYCSLLQNKHGVYIVRASQSAQSRMVVIYVFLRHQISLWGAVFWNGALYILVSIRVKMLSNTSSTKEAVSNQIEPGREVREWW